jgi:catechol 2,3-dioxygenase-like lactoylglutathione lyase family enzyme
MEKVEIRDMSPLLSVFDMQTSVHFYCDLLGFEMVDHSPFYAEGEFHWAMLRFGEVELMLNTAYDEGERPDHPDPARVASHGDVVFYLGCPDVDFAYRHLVAHGVKVAAPRLVRYGGVRPWRVLSVFDPDGYPLCLQWPVPKSNSEPSPAV